MITKDTPYEHRSHHGTWFRSATCDLRNGVHVDVSELPQGRPLRDLLRMVSADVAEFTIFHAQNILPEIRGTHFSGYDAVEFVYPEDLSGLLDHAPAPLEYDHWGAEGGRKGSP